MGKIKGKSKSLFSLPENSFEEDKIYQQLYRAIFEQQLAPGTKLGEDSLAEIFEVSRTRIRRVLLQLSHDYLIRLEPNRGAFVASPSPEEAKQVFAARRMVESAIIKDIVKVITSDQLALIKALSAEEQLACDHSDRRNIIKLSGQFHLEIAKITGNEFIVKFLKDLISQTSLIIALYGVSGASLCVRDDHKDLLEAIASGNADIAVASLLKHLQQVERSLNLDDHRLSPPVNLKDIFA